MQAIYVQRNNEARKCNHSYSGKAVILTLSECAFIALALRIQQAKRMRHIVICDLPRSTGFCYIILKKARF
jgi:hypothetical protein